MLERAQPDVGWQVAEEGESRLEFVAVGVVDRTLLELIEEELLAFWGDDVGLARTSRDANRLGRFLDSALAPRLGCGCSLVNPASFAEPFQTWV